MIDVRDGSPAARQASPHSYRALLVHAEPSGLSSRRVRLAGLLARRLDATLIGVGAEAFDPAPLADPYFGDIGGDLVPLLREQMAERLRDAGTRFRADCDGADVAWRRLEDFPARAIVQTARAADLVVLGSRGSLGAIRQADPAEVVMTCGRPVLLVPPAAEHLRASRIVVAWKDAREARRAVADAMPFLQRAEEVVIHTVCEGEDRAEAAELQTDDVVDHLKRHGVQARAVVTNAAPEGVAREILRLARQNDADLVVAGAYGHSRLREWAFGGVTNDLLKLTGAICVLLSH